MCTMCCGHDVTAADMLGVQAEDLAGALISNVVEIRGT